MPVTSLGLKDAVFEPCFSQIWNSKIKVIVKFENLNLLEKPVICPVFHELKNKSANFFSTWVFFLYSLRSILNSGEASWNASCFFQKNSILKKSRKRVKNAHFRSVFWPLKNYFSAGIELPVMRLKLAEVIFCAEEDKRKKKKIKVMVKLKTEKKPTFSPIVGVW